MVVPERDEGEGEGTMKQEKERCEKKRDHKDRVRLIDNNSQTETNTKIREN